MKDNQKPEGTTTTPAVTKPHKSIVLPVIGIIAAIGLLLLAWWFAIRPTPTPTTTPDQPPTPALTQAQIDAFFQSEVRPALDAYDARNKAAVDRAVERISNGVEQYREGIKPFVEDITSWGTRFGVIRRWGSDLGEKWWGDAANATKVHRYVSEKFERHLFSDAKLNALVAESLEQFRDDLAASQNRLHADVKAAWQKSAHAQHEVNLQKLVQQVNESVQAKSSKMATDSLTVGVVSFIAGSALEEAARALVKVIIARVAAYIATSAATTTATSGGATATTTAAVGGGGTVLGGPVGTVIGAAAGLVVGMIADWWTTNKLEKKLTTECNEMVTGVKSQILIGTTRAPGLKYALVESLRILREGEEDALRASLQEVAQ
jgi:hypothetical protein